VKRASVKQVEPETAAVRHADPMTIRDAIDVVLVGGHRSTLKATAKMSAENAQELATRIMGEKDAGDRMRVYTRGQWLHIDPAGVERRGRDAR